MAKGSGAVAKHASSGSAVKTLKDAAEKVRAPRSAGPQLGRTVRLEEGYA